MNQREIFADFQRRYEHGFVWVVHPDNKEESLFYVDSIVPDDKTIASMSLSSPEYGKIILNYGTAHSLRFKYPPVGVFQSGQDAMIFRRVPARQWKYALYSGNSVCHDVAFLLRGNRRAPTELLFDNVLAAFQNMSYRFGEAIHMLKSGKYRSVALKRNFSLVLSMNGKEQYMLMFWEQPIAYIAIADGAVQMIDPAFKNVVQQVKDN